ncbi:testin [Tribolium madens]|uniref:testin n=1 Tax=Tribolium madens TaxID=41895 RepID=UPI001CF72D51|nr:testin [Tribolium madens]
MSECDAPNWLTELEKKREIRLKARLGHEAGAGAPCITCSDKCPGLDLHFWRKICKNCKCSKEDHDVHDDDIYGWAQFQLLGSKPTRTKRKIVLPGKKDEVELEWAPKGNSETIDRYLKTVAPEMLPVKGSQAAQERKQLLQKQIPIHDLDPSLCHELTDSELNQMQDYIKHMKGSAGVGQIIQFGINYGNYHLGGDPNAKIVSDRIPKTIPAIETVQLLPKHFDKLSMKDQKELDAFFDKIPKPHNMTVHAEKLGYVNSPNLENSDNNAQFMSPETSLGRFARELIPHSNLTNEDLACDVTNQNVPAKFKTDPNSNKTLPEYNPSLLNVPESQLVPNSVKIGSIRDITYTSDVKSDIKTEDSTPEEGVPEIETKHCRKCRKQFAPGEFAIFVEKSTDLFHNSCFKCAGCNQNLADLLYFYDKESGDVYCGRDFAKIRGIPRCKACDELIFVKEYCLAENSTFHLKHFCCFECDEALAGQNYVVEDSQPICLPCFEKVKANKCTSCLRVIRPDEEGLTLAPGIHFHTAEECFCCSVCKKPLLGAKLLFRNGKLFCSHECFRSDN